MIHEKFGVVIFRSGYKGKQFSNTTSALQRHAQPAIWMKHEKLKKKKVSDTSCCIV
jgi:hypothetical protein